MEGTQGKEARGLKWSQGTREQELNGLSQGEQAGPGRSGIATSDPSLRAPPGGQWKE